MYSWRFASPTFVILCKRNAKAARILAALAWDLDPKAIRARTFALLPKRGPLERRVRKQWFISINEHIATAEDIVVALRNLCWNFRPYGEHSGER